MALVMARSAKRVAVKYGDLSLARAVRDLQARALTAIRMRQSYLPDETSASAKLPTEQKLITEETAYRIRPPTASEAESMVDSAYERGMREALEILRKRELITEEAADRVRPLTPSEMDAMVDRHQEQALREAADRYKAKKSSSGHKSPASSRTAYPTASALVMARSMKRVAVMYGDLGLARRARDLLKQAMQAIKKRQSVLSDGEDGGV